MHTSRLPVFVALAITAALIVLSGCGSGSRPSAAPPPDAGIHRDVGAAPAGRPKVAPSGPDHLVLIVLDGARPDYFNVPGIPHVRAFIQRATTYKNAWDGILEAETPPGHLTITTGSEPRDGLIPGFSWANSQHHYETLFDPRKIRAGDMEKIVRASGVPTIAGQVKKKFPSAKVVALGGYKYYADDALGGPYSDLTMYYDLTHRGWAPVYIPARPAPPKGLMTKSSLIYKTKTTHLPLGIGNSYAMRLADATFKRMKPKVMLVNLPEFDRPLGHDLGSTRDMKAVRTLMQRFDKDLATMENAYKQAGLLDRTVFVITADHGMMPVSWRVKRHLIPNTIRRAGGQIAYGNYTTADYIWLANPGKARVVAKALVKLNNRYIQSVYYKTGTGSKAHFVRASSTSRFLVPGIDAANQYLLNTFNSPRGPNLVLLAAEGADTIGDTPYQWKGNHGGANWSSQSVPLYIAGPGVRSGYISSYPARLMDIAPTVLNLLGTSPGSMRGLPLADALVQSTPAQQAAQKAEGNTLGPLVDALRAESHAEFAQHR